MDKRKEDDSLCLFTPQPNLVYEHRIVDVLTLVILSSYCYTDGQVQTQNEWSLVHAPVNTRSTRSSSFVCIITLVPLLWYLSEQQTVHRRPSPSSDLELAILTCHRVRCPWASNREGKWIADVCFGDNNIASIVFFLFVGGILRKKE